MQLVALDAKTSAGQVADVPVQLSATSHAPAEGRQTVLLDWKTSVGQVALEPVHVSAASQAPAVARQVAPAFPGVWVQVLPLGGPVPTQVSTVHGFESSQAASFEQASVNDVCAVRPDVSPFAVTVYVTPASCGSGAYSVLMRVPLESATE